MKKLINKFIETSTFSKEEWLAVIKVGSIIMGALLFLSALEYLLS